MVEELEELFSGHLHLMELLRKALLEVEGDWREFSKFLAEGRAALRQRAQRCGIAVQFSKRCSGLDYLELSAGVHSNDQGTPCLKIRHHVSHGFFRNPDLKFVNGLK